jgi:hypothetical protein
MCSSFELDESGLPLAGYECVIGGVGVIGGGLCNVSGGVVSSGAGDVGSKSSSSPLVKASGSSVSGNAASVVSGSGGRLGTEPLVMQPVVLSAPSRPPLPESPVPSEDQSHLSSLLNKEALIWSSVSDKFLNSRGKSVPLFSKGVHCCFSRCAFGRGLQVFVSLLLSDVFSVRREEARALWPPSSECESRQQPDNGSTVSTADVIPTNVSLSGPETPFSAAPTLSMQPALSSVTSVFDFPSGPVVNPFASVLAPSSFSRERENVKGIPGESGQSPPVLTSHRAPVITSQPSTASSAPKVPTAFHAKSGASVSPMLSVSPSSAPIGAPIPTSSATAATLPHPPAPAAVTRAGGASPGPVAPFQFGSTPIQFGVGFPGTAGDVGRSAIPQFGVPSSSAGGSSSAFPFAPVSFPAVVSQLPAIGVSTVATPASAASTSARTLTSTHNSRFSLGK